MTYPSSRERPLHPFSMSSSSQYVHIIIHVYMCYVARLFHMSNKHKLRVEVTLFYIHPMLICRLYFVALLSCHLFLLHLSLLLSAFLLILMYSRAILMRL